MLLNKCKNNSFGFLIITILSGCGNSVSQKQLNNDIYPTATKYSTICYAEDVSSKPSSARILAAHFQTDSILDVSWMKQFDQEGNYEVVISYSVTKPGATISITAGNETINDSLPVTSGVYLESKDWYNFNCERRLLSKSVSLAKGMNTIQLKLSPGLEETNLTLYNLEFM
ncbi:MAG TPA: hypothetical protein VK616_03455, partial [Flavitalea sp.]|nr:hypothetical protein [Flavitalea sp.]